MLVKVPKLVHGQSQCWNIPWGFLAEKNLIPHLIGSQIVTFWSSSNCFSEHLLWDPSSGPWIVRCFLFIWGLVGEENIPFPFICFSGITSHFPFWKKEKSDLPLAVISPLCSEGNWQQSSEHFCVWSKVVSHCFSLVF